MTKKAKAPSVRIRAAYHVAGHAVVGVHYGFVVKEVLIHDRAINGSNGHCTLQEGELTKDRDLSGALAYTMAGDIGVEQYLKKRLSFFQRSPDDFANFKRLVAIERGSDVGGDIYADLDAVREFVRTNLIEPKWHVVKRIAEALIEQRRLSGDDVRQMCETENENGGDESHCGNVPSSGETTQPASVIDPENDR